MGIWVTLAAWLSIGWARLPNVVVTAESVEVVQQYQRWAAQNGLTGAALLPACRAWSQSFYQCFSVEEKGQYRMVHLGDLQRWESDLDALEMKAREVGRVALSEHNREVVFVEGIKRPYWVFDGSKGLGASVLLFPDELEDMMGARPVLGTPARGVVVAWLPGDEELDKVVSVGLVRIFGDATVPISSAIVQWSGGHWATWGEAKKLP